METVKVRAAVVVTTEGRWEAVGCSGWPDVKNMWEAESAFNSEEREGCSHFILEAELQVPEQKEPEVVKATVTEA